MALDDDVKAMATTTNFATLTTLFPDGHPQTQVMWVDADDEHLLINTETHRQKFKNVQRDPRVTVTVWDRESPYRYAEVRGEVVDTVAGEEARAHIEACSHRYLGRPYPNPVESERVILRIRADRVHKLALG
jgi:PPOX class probable F420-dependent enzyme